jgi:signal transduction histidine kinase
LTVELDDALPRLFADPGKIKQVLVNIVFNAIKFTPRNGRVILKAWARRESGS